MDRDETIVKLGRRVRKLTRVNRVLVAERDRADRNALRLAVELDQVREFMSETGLCDHCRRALRSAARVEFAA